MDQEFTVYTRPNCRYCDAALELLARRGLRFRKLDVRADPALLEEMYSRSGRFTFPQIFVGERHLGGCDEVLALDRTGELTLLAAGAAQ
ncbi:MAG: glutaredoxin 3 [Phenylobacterium sp.]|uniref:glutaredoxin 3 n=1 Tax=Phenylobacterium sp. TaxID=1871053 RepID=UPI003919B38B